MWRNWFHAAGLEPVHLVAMSSTLITPTMTRYKITDEQLVDAVQQSVSYAGVLRVLGVRPAGGSHYHYSNRIKKLGIDTSHFTGKMWNKGKTWKHLRKNSSDILTILIEGSRRQPRKFLLRAMIEEGVKYKCSICEIENWLGKEICLHVDHKNGDWLDCRLDNLRFLCPNCHTQTPTFGSKNKKST